MDVSVNTLREQAKEILAASTLELFPGTRLLGGEISEIGFSYDFQFPKEIVPLFGERELLHLEDHMRMLASQKREIATLDMMRENAKDFFYHLGQRERGDQIGRNEKNIVSIFKMGAFHDECRGPFIRNSSEIGAFKLLESEVLPSKAIRITGTTFAEKQELKEFLKKFKEAKKRDCEVLGPRLDFCSQFQGRWVYHPKGEVILTSLIQKWREMHTELGFSFIHSFGMQDPLALHKYLFSISHSPLPLKLASFGPRESDFVTIFMKKKDLQTEIISSLHFIDKVIKIFGFETRISLVYSPKGDNSFLLKALEQSGLEFSREKGENERVAFFFTDILGRRRQGPFVGCEANEEIGIVYRSLFGSIESWLSLLVEKTKQE